MQEGDRQNGWSENNEKRQEEFPLVSLASGLFVDDRGPVGRPLFGKRLDGLADILGRLKALLWILLQTPVHDLREARTNVAVLVHDLGSAFVYYPSLGCRRRTTTKG